MEKRIREELFSLGILSNRKGYAYTDLAVELLEGLPGDKEFLRELFLSLCTRRK